MQETYSKLLKGNKADDHIQKLAQIPNRKFHEFIEDSIKLCQPDNIYIVTDSDEDAAYVREMSIKNGEEKALKTKGHTIHFDGMNDQGRDREVTKYLVPKTDSLSKALNQIEREEGLTEVRGLLKGSMKGRTMIVRFLSLGPAGSAFSIPCVQATDSWYVAHAESLLYRTAYEPFRKLAEDANCFRFLHSAGKLDKNMVSVDENNKRIYIDYTKDWVYSVNTQYAGNTVGLKKLALRLAIRQADTQGWLAEHMFLAGIFGPNGRKTYFGGAFPSACGKTSTAMLPGEKIMGDDIAYFRNINGQFRAVNAESGIFGIIQNVTSKDDPAIWEVLNKPEEVIFSNILINDGKPYWLGMGTEPPDKGVNFSGEWVKGKKDSQGNEIPLAHKNARYAVTLKALTNCDSELDNPQGVELSGIMYGGRDAKSYVPVQQAFDWAHGIVAYGASLETETTFAIVGKEGIPEINLMSIQDFVAIPLGKYIQNNLDFVKGIKNPPLIFGVNYFLRDSQGKFVNGVRDKHVWIKWMELRVHNEVDAIIAPTGMIPKYEDLAKLFKQVLNKEYTKEDYVSQFTIRVPENLAKIDRIVKFHHENVSGAPSVLFDVLEKQRSRLEQLQKEKGKYVSPFEL
ncbi:MAG: phosphoenolpyruvate carboxykinase (GTP) [Planctomycetes bacterium]|nr:phosphoenolpyruvate carboxykinase (GTP) [Planctomycetota bacterium]